MKTRYMVIGYGWRADFYYRIAKLLPEQFSVCAGVLRTEERAKEVSVREQVFATANLDEALAVKPDFAVLCVPRGIVKDYLIQLMERGIPVLCETPPGKDTEELRELWQQAKAYGGRVQIVEQYFLQPYYAGILDIIKRGYLGNVSSVMLSALHGYHAVSIFRKILGIGYENCTIQGKKFWSEVTATNGRNGFDESGTVMKEDRDWAFMQFENGKTAFMDFEGEQYFSLIRTRRWNIRGVRGEINDMTVRFLNELNQPVEQTINRVDVGTNNNSEWSHKGMMFLDRAIYQNPFYPARMNDDEIAVASCLAAMKEFVENGTEFYSLREALQDTYLSFEMERAVETGETIKTEAQPWAL
ncbi:MAG: Gfo/Idh/MocA family oxidoreductase [Blautia sp.]|nr:Gfo/Idh/MocA family oxidoreductase [Blautia sp.]MDY5030579.1 Gfo/Idh/MocA family oxidoreductase [Blautia sp.]